MVKVETDFGDGDGELFALWYSLKYIFHQVFLHGGFAEGELAIICKTIRGVILNKKNGHMFMFPRWSLYCIVIDRSNNVEEA
jgi:hypothetical protein